MADIRAFSGLVYASGAGSEVLAPPYDVIDDEGRRALADKSEHNAVHLILPQGEGDQRYANAEQLFEAWRSEEVLTLTGRKALYRYHQVFQHPEAPEQTVTRRGLIAAVRLHRFDEKVILPHERTLKGPKLDRLNLMRATRAHLSPIFGLYSDPSGESDRLFEGAEERQPDFEGTTDDGTRHRLWVVDDAELHGAYARIIGPKPLYIADGHHRYETMLAYRDELRDAAGGSLPADSSGEFATMFLANMDDPGMLVMPTHRLIHSVADFDLGEFQKRLEAWFERRPVDAEPGAIQAALHRLARPGFVLALPDGSTELLELRAGKEHPALSGAVGSLDVSMLHTIVLEDIMGVDKAAQEAKTNIHYVQGIAKALRGAVDHQATFLLRPTTLAQVRAVSDAGEYMPQKSTFFVPKLASGMLYRHIDAGQAI